MSSSGHRLHVEFDDLSVVDEEEELKKDKEPKVSMSSEDKGRIKQAKDGDLLRMKSLNGYKCFSPCYGSPVTCAPPSSYLADGSFVYPAGDRAELGRPLPFGPPSLLSIQRPDLYDDSFASIGSCEQLGIANVPPEYDDKRRQDRVTYGSPIGWQSNVYAHNQSFPTSRSFGTDGVGSQQSIVCPPPMFQPPDQLNVSARSRAASLIRGAAADDQQFSQGRSFLPKRKLLQLYDDGVNGPGLGEGIETKGTASAELLPQNGWSPGNSRFCCNDRQPGREGQMGRTEIRKVAMGPDCDPGSEDGPGCVGDRPKHFFAPLSAMMQNVGADSGDKTANLVETAGPLYYENFGTGKSSSSDRTTSTIISARHFQPHTQLAPTLLEFLGDKDEKGPADICVNGGIAAFVNGPSGGHRITEEKSNNRSSDDFFISDRQFSRDSSRHDSNNPLIKSFSCQDLSSDQMQNALFDMAKTFQADGKCQKLTKSDNTLDNPMAKSSKPFRSQLNVTLKFPGHNCPDGSNNSGKQLERYTPETPEIPKLPALDYRLLNNPFLKSFESRSGIYGNNDIRGPLGRLLGTKENESSSELDKMLQQQQQQQHEASAIDYSSAVLTQSFARRLNPDENTVKATRSYEIESDRHGGLMSSKTTCQVTSIDPRIIGTASKQQRQDYQVTSFEAPNPRSLHDSLGAYDVDSIRLLTGSSTANPVLSNCPKFYRNVPFVPETPGLYCSGSQTALRQFYENQKEKVPAQTQTSLEDDSTTPANEATESSIKNAQVPETDNRSGTESPASTKRKRVVRKDRLEQKTSKRPLSPAAQRRRLRKQSSSDVTAETGVIEDNKLLNKSRRRSSKSNSITVQGAEHTEEKNESRSSSSGQESPRKEQNGRISMYFNTKKRSSVGSIKTTTSFSAENTRDIERSNRSHGENVETTNSERERTNSASSREAGTSKGRKSSISSGKLPWCACWGNGCV